MAKIDELPGIPKTLINFGCRLNSSDINVVKTASQAYDRTPFKYSQATLEFLPFPRQAGWAVPCDRKGPTTEAGRTEGRNAVEDPERKRRVAVCCGGPRRERRPPRPRGSQRPTASRGARRHEPAATAKRKGEKPPG